MICEKCSTELPDDAVACYRCGTMTGLTFVTPPKAPSPQSQSTAAATIMATVATTMVVLLILAIVGGIVVFVVMQKNANERPTTTSTNSVAVNTTRSQNPVSAPAPPKQRETIVNEQFPVPARNYKFYEFTVSQPSIVSGGFVAYGGNNDINAILVDEANYTFVVNGMDARSYYNTGYTMKGKPKIRIPAGHYYFIFDNRKALLTDKSVAAEIYVEPQ